MLILDQSQILCRYLKVVSMLYYSGESYLHLKIMMHICKDIVPEYEKLPKRDTRKTCLNNLYNDDYS